MVELTEKLRMPEEYGGQIYTIRMKRFSRALFDAMQEGRANMNFDWVDLVLMTYVVDPPLTMEELHAEDSDLEFQMALCNKIVELNQISRERIQELQKKITKL